MLRLLAAPAKGYAGLLIASMIGLSLVAIWAIFTAIAYETYATEWKAAATYAENVTTLFARDISRTIEIYDLSIKSAAINAADPVVLALPPPSQKKIIFDHAAEASGFGAMILTDKSGRVSSDSHSLAKVGLDFSDRDYFLAQKDLTLTRQPFIGHLIKSRVTGQLMMAVSRPIVAPDGSFGGVVCGSIMADFFERLFSAVALPRDSSVMMIHNDNAVLMRVPYRHDTLGRTLDTAELVTARTSGGGTFVRHSSFDQVERIYGMQQVGDLPIYIVVGLSTKQIFAHWLLRATLIGLGFVVLTLIILLLAFTLARELYRRAAAERTLSELASTDSLTHLANRRRFNETLDIEWRRAIRESSSLALLMVDGDFFKAFNDTYGHLKGDAALKVIADTLSRCAERPGDLVARFGGEEFVVLLPRTDREGAYKIAVAMHDAITDAALPHLGSPLGRLTVSVGVAARAPLVQDRSADLIEAADAALYAAKAEGRNRIVRDEIRPARRPASRASVARGLSSTQAIG